MAVHLVFSRGTTRDRPVRLTVAEGPSVDQLTPGTVVDEPGVVRAVLRVLAEGGRLDDADLEARYGARLRELAQLLEEAGRWHAAMPAETTGAEGIGVDKPA